MDRIRMRNMLGYVSFALICTLAHCYRTFPGEAAAARLETEVRAATDGRLDIQIQELSLYGLLGLEVEGVVVEHRGKDNTTRVTLDRATSRVGLWQLLRLRQAWIGTLHLGKGEIAWDVVRKDKGLEIDLRVENLAAKRLVEGQSFGKDLEVGGRVNARLRGFVAHNKRFEPNLAASDLKIEWHFAKLELGPGKAGGIQVPKAKLGDIDLSVKLANKRFTINDFAQKGGDIRLRATGKGSLSAQWASSTIDGCLAFRANEAYLTANPKVGVALQLAQVRLRKGTDGFLNVPIGGRFGKIALRKGLCRQGRRR